MKRQTDGRTLALVLGSSGTTKSVLLFSIVCFCAYSFFCWSILDISCFQFSNLSLPLHSFTLVFFLSDTLSFSGGLVVSHVLTTLRQLGESRTILRSERLQCLLTLLNDIVLLCDHVTFKLLFLTLSHTMKLHMTCASK